MKLVPACATASLTTAGVVFFPLALAALLDNPNDPPTASELLALAYSLVLYALLFGLLLGVPIHWVLRRLGCRSLWHYLLVAALVGLGIARLYFDPADGVRWFLASVVLLAGASSIGALTFWRNYVRGA